MRNIDHASVSSVVPLLRYRHPSAAIEWLQTAFGFEPREIVKGAGGEVVSAELAFGGVTVMVAPVAFSAFDQLMKQPDEIGGAETQCCYLIVDDPDAHCAMATAAGADIVIGLDDYPSGGRGYACRDPEGHIWHCGSFKFASNAKPVAPAAMPPQKPGRQAHLPRAVLAALFAVGISPVVLVPGDPATHRASETRSALAPVVVAAATAVPKMKIDAIQQQLEQEIAARTKFEAAVASIAAQLETEEHRRRDAERASREAHEKLAAGRTGAETFEHANRELSAEIERVQSEQSKAQHQVVDTSKRLDAAESDLKQATDRNTALQQDIAEHKMKLEAAEQSATEAQRRLAEHQSSKLDTVRAASGSALELEQLRTAKLLAEQKAADAQEKIAATLAEAESAQREARQSSAALEDEKRSKAQAWKLVSDLRAQIARRNEPKSAAKKNLAVTVTTEEADFEPDTGSNAGGYGGNVKEPPYNGPLSPF